MPCQKIITLIVVYLILINIMSFMDNSDYNYLFERICTASKNVNFDVADGYTEANNTRRLLEAFLSFKYPNNGDLYSLIFGCKTSHIDDVKKTRIFKYINLFSHDDGNLGKTDAFDMNQLLKDSQAIIIDALKLIEEVDQIHFSSMLKTITQ